MMTENTLEVVEKLSSRYEFNKEEALLYLKEEGVNDMDRVENKRVTKKEVERVERVERDVPCVPLPFVGVVKEDWCQGLRVCHGLYNQCTNGRGESGLCRSCDQGGKAKHGYVTERVEQGESWRDAKGKSPVQYGNVLKKLGISKEKALEEAERFGITIPEGAFVVVSGRKGRPKKQDSTRSSDEKVETDVKCVNKSGDPPAAAAAGAGAGERVKKRGRPKKVKPVEAACSGDDLIASLVSKAMETETQAQEEQGHPEIRDLRTPGVNGTCEEEAVADKDKEKATVADKEKAVVDKAELELEEEEDDTFRSVSRGLRGVPAEEEDEEDEEEVEVEKFEHKGKTYLKDSNNVVYDIESQEPIGKWNPKDKKIMPLNDEDEE